MQHSAAQYSGAISNNRSLLVEAEDEVQHRQQRRRDDGAPGARRGAAAAALRREPLLARQLARRRRRLLEAVAGEVRGDLQRRAQRAARAGRARADLVGDVPQRVDRLLERLDEVALVQDRDRGRRAVVGGVCVQVAFVMSVRIQKLG